VGNSVSDGDECRKQAKDARQMASRSLKQEDKAFWLAWQKSRSSLPRSEQEFRPSDGQNSS
jgi:hypothetical protein